MKKRIFASLLALIMLLGLLPVSALAANGTGHKISVKIYKVVLDSSKPLGYQNPELVKTITVTCTDGTAHSGYNHFVNLKAFYPDETKDWTGWQFASYYTKGKDLRTFTKYTSNTVNATANVTGSEPYPCSKNFYLVYKDSNPEVTFTLNYDANGGTGAPASQTGKSRTGSCDFTISNTVPTKQNYDFQGWSTSQNAAEADYQPGGRFTATSLNTTLYAVWTNHEHKDDDGDGFCDKDHACMHPKGDDGCCTEEDCTHPDSCCPKKPSAPQCSL